MKNRYEALIVLNTQGREDTVKDIVDRLESEFQKEGAEIEQVQKMDKRPFSYVAGPLDSGFYVNFVFHADPQLITKLRSKFKLDNGEKGEEVTYVDVVLWARLAEIAGEYLKKGRPVFIEGRLQLDTWDDKQSGQKRSKLRVIGETMQLLGSRPSAAAAGPPEAGDEGSRSTTRPTAPPPKTAAPAEPDDDEIPF